MARRTYLTTEEVAEQFQVHRTTITRWVKKGLLMPVRETKSGYLFRAADIEVEVEVFRGSRAAS